MKREQSASRKNKKKISYSRPKILWHEKIEALAVVCGAANGKGDNLMCPFGPINS